MKTYVGIDPGKTGCVAIIVDPMGYQVLFHDAEQIDLHDLSISIGNDAFVLLEKPQVMHPKRKRDLWGGETIVEPAKQGVVSMLNYGIGYGEYLGMLKVLRVPYAEIHPMTWKREFSLIRQDKQRSIDVAKHLYPSAADRLTRKKDHGRAEALLIAEYARRRNM